MSAAVQSLTQCGLFPNRTVRDQGYKAIDMFVKKCEALTANMVNRLMLRLTCKSSRIFARSPKQSFQSTMASKQLRSRRQVRTSLVSQQTRLVQQALWPAGLSRR